MFIYMCIYAYHGRYLSICGCKYVYVCKLTICMYVCMYVLCAPSLRGDDLIKPSCDLKTSILLHFYRVPWRHTIRQYFYVQSMGGKRSRSKKYLLVCLDLWHINLCMLFNAKSIFIQTILFQTIQISISTQFNCQNISISDYSVYSNSSNSTIQFRIRIDFVYLQLFVQTVLFQTIQFSVITVSMSKTVLFKTILFSISTQFKCENSSISSNAVKHKYTVLFYLTH